MTFSNIDQLYFTFHLMSVMREETGLFQISVILLCWFTSKVISRLSLITTFEYILEKSALNYITKIIITKQELGPINVEVK